ncbi:hypothetical protein [Paenibacillus sp. SI8]|uniref:hypothetical protein n=1 Tax=unclassified Paenibacillus TaxID=185978 RepID=UPI0034651D44
MQTLYAVISSLIILIGIIHCGLTWKIYSEKSRLEALWFFGCGLLLIVDGLFNFALISGNDHGVLKLLCVASNLIGTLFTIGAAILLPKVHVYVLLVLLMSISVLSVFI